MTMMKKEESRAKETKSKKRNETETTKAPPLTGSSWLERKLIETMTVWTKYSRIISSTNSR